MGSGGAAGALPYKRTLRLMPSLTSLASAALVALRDVTVIDPWSQTAPLEDQTIVVIDGVIRAMGPVATVEVPAGLLTVEGARSRADRTRCRRR